MKLRNLKSITNLKFAGRVFASAVILSTLSGCLISPYSNQEFSSRDSEVPITLITTSNTHPVTVECAKASGHGNPYNGESSYQLIATIQPNDQSMRDPKGQEVYSASTSKVIPDDCWRYYSYGSDNHYRTVLRILQNGADNTVFTFDQDGLVCLGSRIGITAQWFGWLEGQCQRRYINTGNNIRTVVVKART